MVMAAMFSITAVNAQGGGQRQQQPPEERAKSVVDKMIAMNLDADTKTKVTTIFVDFYKAQQTTMEEMRASGNFDREAFGAKSKELGEARDKKLKAVFTEAQMKQWKDEIEPTTVQQRGGGGGQRGGGK